MHSTPASLLERLRRPNEQIAWDRFVQLYTPLLFHWARRAGMQTQDAADLVQDVFAVLVEKLPTFTYDRSKSFRAWLRTIALNKWRDRAKVGTPEAMDPHGVTLASVANPDPLDRLIESEFRQGLARRALELMKADFRETTWRACWESVVMNRPATEIATELGITVRAVYSANCRILGRLRNELAGMLD